MVFKMSMRNQSSFLCLAALPILVVAAAGCSQSEAATPRAAPENAASAPAEAKAKIDSETYSLEIKGTGKYRAGQEGAVEIALASKGAYHINDKYPIKFKVVDPAPEGVTFPKPVLKREDGKFEQSTGSLKVPFVAAKSGKARVAGTLSFSVCSEANCIMEKQELAAVVDVE